MSKAKLILFDLDGTLYLDGVLFPGVKELIEKLSKSSLQYGFLTNNSTVGPNDYYRKLKRLGLTLKPHNVVTSCEASCRMLKGMQLGPEIYILGTRKFKAYMASQGYLHSYEKAKALLIGFDTELTYRKLTEATRLVLAGLPIVASHPDPICPGDLPDAGLLLEYFKAVKPGTIIQAIAGKPHRWLVELLEQRFQVKREEIIMVGDRVNTDMRFAANFNMRSMLVLNGQKQPELGDLRPTLIVAEIQQLLDAFWPENLGW
ncbi:MAG: HAD-IIA family hydrolase [Lentisphaeria bacterium]